ncbi:hypothetical protein UT300007_25490 [Clostridium sp. CTA-7]
MENVNFTTPEYVFSNPSYMHYLVQYEGNKYNKLDNTPGVYVTVIDDNYAVVSILSGMLEDIENTKSVLDLVNNLYNSEDFMIVYVLPPEIYTLQEISAVEASDVSYLQEELPLKLTGKGVVVGIIDTGIDYLNEEFMDSEGKTRINAIWDQTISSNKENKIVPFGTIYTKDEIDSAINIYRNGGNPYDVVASKDEIGHGTNIAGIVGASGKNKDIKGVAPDCEFVVIKLIEAQFYKYNYEPSVPVFNAPAIFGAIEFLRDYLVREKKPVVVLLPLGSNNGNHKGNHILDNYIATVSSNIGIVIVTGSGNQGIQDGHVSGIIKNKGDYDSIELIVAKSQKLFFMDVWVDLPNIMEINLVAPSGESTGIIPAILNINKKYSFVFEQTKTNIYYYLPEEYTGDQLIRLYFWDIQPGMWRLTIRLSSGKMAKYNAWLLQKGLVAEGTRFTPSDPYGTLTIPGDSDYVVTVAAYNQNNNNLLAYSGAAFIEESLNRIDFAAGGVNTKTTGLGNSVDIVNGTSVAAAVGAGACILLFQWGIVKGNYPYMYSQSIKTFLNRGTIKRRGDIYPNPQLGYGIINFYKIFENMI